MILIPVTLWVMQHQAVCSLGSKGCHVFYIISSLYESLHLATLNSRCQCCSAFTFSLVSQVERGLIVWWVRLLPMKNSLLHMEHTRGKQSPSSFHQVWINAYCFLSANFTLNNQSTVNGFISCSVSHIPYALLISSTKKFCLEYKFFLNLFPSL